MLSPLRQINSINRDMNDLPPRFKWKYVDLKGSSSFARQNMDSRRLSLGDAKGSARQYQKLKRSSCPENITDKFAVTLGERRVQELDPIGHLIRGSPETLFRSWSSIPSFTNWKLVLVPTQQACFNQSIGLHPVISSP